MTVDCSVKDDIYKYALRIIDNGSLFRCKILIKRGNLSADSRSYLELLLLLSASRGTQIQIVADGKDEQKALDFVGDVLSGKVDETYQQLTRESSGLNPSRNAIDRLHKINSSVLEN